MVGMTNNYKGSLTPEEQDGVMAAWMSGDSIRGISTKQNIPYGKVRAFAEWQCKSMPDLIPPPKEGPKILIFDIENTAATGRFFGKPYKTRILKVVQDWYLLCAAYKWFGDDEIGFFSLEDDPKFFAGSTDDTYVAKRLWRLLDQADIVIAHNGDSFDTKKCNTRFSVLKMGPPRPYQTIDTLKEDRRYFNRTSHSLKNVAEALGLTDKISNSGYDLWEMCMANEREGWQEMMEYNIQDVGTLEELYIEQREWIGMPGKKAHPNLGHWANSEDPVCPNCAHTKLTVRGWYRTAFSEFPLLQCHKASGGCGSYHRSRSRVPQRTKAERVDLV